MVIILSCLGTDEKEKDLYMFSTETVFFITLWAVAGVSSAFTLPTWGHMDILSRRGTSTDSSLKKNILWKAGQLGDDCSSPGASRW
jgi:hypothetical protein